MRLNLLIYHFSNKIRKLSTKNLVYYTMEFLVEFHSEISSQIHISSQPYFQCVPKFSRAMPHDQVMF